MLTAAALVMPLVGTLDSARLRVVQAQALQALEHSGARYLILDITGVAVIDTQVAHGLLQVVQAARLLGTEVILVGIRPEVAQSLVGLGIHFNNVRTRRTLQGSIAYVLQARLIVVNYLCRTPPCTASCACGDRQSAGPCRVAAKAGVA